ncbi:MAG: RES family NAD+ phosphorylase [Pyrinomonadaceae bacterium]
MEAFRLARQKYAVPLTGKGAALKGARWNSVGVELLYTASNRSLAMAEVAVHFTLATLPVDFVMVSIYLPDNITVQKLTEKDLPIDWNAYPHPVSTQAIGDDFVAANQHCVLQIPSVVTHGDFNLLINPNQAEFCRVKVIEVAKFPFDKRIFK